MADLSPLPRVAAVSYLNTVPLIWGFLHGPQKSMANVDFSLPAECADRISQGLADVGLVPVIEVARQNLEVISGLGIACDGPVRSILLISKTSPSRIRTLAADAGSRTSVMLARILLRERFGVEPEIRSLPPKLDTMIAEADAALVIGDPALRIPLDQPGREVFDLGAEWKTLTGLPMVFAVWSGATGANRWADLFHDAWRYGKERIDEIVNHQADRRGLPHSLVRAYLTSHIRFELGDNERKGMQAYLDLAGTFETLPIMTPAL